MYMLEKGRYVVELTVREILKRSHFKNTNIAAGNNGLDRKVKWVHIVEIETFGHLLNGKEMILSTGVEWANDTGKSLFYLQQLLDFNASALCIELIGDNQSPPLEMLQLADQHNFPIILFKGEVKFIDITRDIHEIILGYQESFWWELEDLYQAFNKILVSNGTIEAFLKELHLITNKQVILVHDTAQFWFFPSPTPRIQEKIKMELKTNKNHTHYYGTPIYFLDDNIAYLYITEEYGNVSLFNQLAVKRCGEFLTQYFWKFYQQEEIKKVKKNEWIIEALNGGISGEKVATKLMQENPAIHLNEAMIAVIPATSELIAEQSDENFFTETLMHIRTIFINEGFYLLGTKDNKLHHYILLLINQRKNSHLYHRLHNALNRIKKLPIQTSVSEKLQWLSFGKSINSFDHIRTGYQTALSTLHFQKNMQTLDEPFYHKLALYRVVEKVHDASELREMINDYIGPLLAHDLKKDTELLKSLQIYLKNFGAKNKTAHELFIVRQTLYHRLAKIKALLGEDYMDPENRVMIEFSIYALQYLELSGLPVR